MSAFFGLMITLTSASPTLTAPNPCAKTESEKVVHDTIILQPKGTVSL